MGGCAGEVHLLASDIAFVGFSWDAVRHAICCEAVPGSTELEDFNRRLCEGVALAPVVKDTIRFGSLACGHTNMGLRAIAAGAPSTCPLLSEGGRFSLAKLERLDKEFAKAVNKGLRWRVLRHDVRTKWPSALNIIQEVDMDVHNSQRAGR